MLRVEIGKDDSGAYSVFSTQGSSASQMTAAKIMGGLNRQKQKTLRPVMTSDLLEVISVIVITSNLEFNSTCRKKNHSQSRWNTFDVTRTTHTKVDVLEESRIDDCWNVDADRNLSDSWQDSRSSLYWTKNFPKDACGPGSAWQRSKQPPDQIMCGLEHGLACQKQLRKKHPWAI